MPMNRTFKAANRQAAKDLNYMKDVLSKNMEPKMDELNRINQAVDAFCADLKDRLKEKHNAGYRGWDGEYSEISLVSEMVKDAQDVALNLPVKKYTTTCTHVLHKRLIDIGAWAMMLWFRHNK